MPLLSPPPLKLEHWERELEIEALVAKNASIRTGAQVRGVVGSLLENRGKRGT